MTQVHATAIAIDEQGILLRGPSGAGKSDLALRMIEQGAQLISDDRVELIKKGAELIAFAPPNIAGLLEIRNIGILKFHNVDATPIRLIVDLVPPEELERHPETQHISLEEIELPLLRIAPFESSAPAKVGLGLALHLGHLERIE